MNSSSIKLVLLDRDGTINHRRGDFVTSADEWEPLPGALEAIARLNHAGFHVVVVSNQTGLGRGLFDVAALNAMQAKMQRMLAAVGGRIDALFYCPHGPEESCGCRMPLPGLFDQIGVRYGVSLAGVPVASGGSGELLAGALVGCEPHLVLTGAFALGAAASAPGVALSAEDMVLPADFPEGTHVHDDLGAFADFIVERDALGGVPAPQLGAAIAGVVPSAAGAAIGLDGAASARS
jgi:D-glycero-D-manno-heptose 1,7-bisphosphate phosphatase